MTIQKHKGAKRIFLALINSLQGFKWLIKNETAFQQELIIILVLSSASCFLNISLLLHLLLIVSLLFVLLVEVINTAVEATIDRIGLEHHSLSGLAKDLGSLAVLISLAIAIATWGVVLWEL
ncbi:diacylglycerol kinase [Colwellia sp. 4_MG-2023]|jgi:diacylglycerol kinase (ATP)|uniref:diacylglycerol kinase n=1 Tax=unclassified Colwellia TaxID=196834 RepID=UPI001C0890CF|nr:MULTISPECIES: diacylglycerol kinase [unclassified Colwellia]MBU2924887.1 diacylglycerol kinase [Colwellia sp. C2M11]MDO6487656.1 diacylglycerol kinase [Colwellia sp. 6_MG-2023]MDO6506786.1 diacylglycerol kinase [Colwellia sp. 5_MG-2023]MDO6555839.1 diacylglycerol kinase [Colwellia sp. 4_MG-2023]MDO6652883.1 diacylglycerol kinase [Colwellia sp. 3_MG-2023]